MSASDEAMDLYEREAVAAGFEIRWPRPWDGAYRTLIFGNLRFLQRYHDAPEPPVLWHYANDVEEREKLMQEDRFLTPRELTANDVALRAKDTEEFGLTEKHVDFLNWSLGWERAIEFARRGWSHAKTPEQVMENRKKIQGKMEPSQRRYGKDGFAGKNGPLCQCGLW